MSVGTKSTSVRQSRRPKDSPGLASVLSLCRGAFAVTGLFSLVINLLMLTGPLFMLQVYDRVLASRSIPTLVALTILIAGLFTFMGLLELVRSRILARVGQRINDEFGERVFDGVIALGLTRTSNVQTQPLRDLDTIRQFLSGPGPLALFDLPWTPVYLGVVYLLHFDLGVLATGGAILLVLLAVWNELLTRAPLAEAAQGAIRAHAFADEGRRNADVIQAMGMHEAIRHRWRQLHGAASTRQTRAGDSAATIASVSKAMRMFLQSAMLALGAYLAIMQETTAGSMIAASILMSRALAPVDQSIAHWRGFLGFRRAHERVRVLLEGISQKAAPMPLPSPTGRVKVEGLVVLAGDAKRPILNGISFALEPGSVLGVIGPTGGGKSTLARALVGIWQPTKGVVTLDGAPLAQWDGQQLGQSVGYLPQEVALFAGTIEDNIARFALEPHPEAVVEAAKLADVHELILRLDAGYNTKIGEGGAALSAGQRQRIALARAVYGQPKFIVLDEPNSNLDADGEIALVQAIKSLKQRGVTVVVIAHRPSAISAVDDLLYLRDGQQLALGPRDEVLSQVTQNHRGRRSASGNAVMRATPESVDGVAG
jgi:PrtD family type I secretion system ABC transporter